jgi:hypothetical protein
LSLLYREGYVIDGSILCGKTKSAQVATEILERGELLGPDTCDWHYVEGLTLSDDPRLALVWDKVGLGHNGQRLAGGGHSVWRNYGEEVIPDSEWPKFLEEQERLMAARTEAAKKGLPALTAKVRLPLGELVDHYDAPYSLHESSGNTSGGVLAKSALRWPRLEDGTYTYALSLNGWRSQSVVVRVSQGRATPDSIVFEMQADNADRFRKPPAADRAR